MKRLLLVPAALLLSFVLNIVTTAQNDGVQIKRLQGLARVWNAAKYFHPYLATRDIDWDKALVDAIPKVKAAKSADEYRVAINSMLSVIGDKSTAVITVDKQVKNPVETAPAADALRLVDGILYVDVYAAGKMQVANTANRGILNVKLNSLLPQAKGVIIDCRGPVKFSVTDDDAVGFYFDDFLRTVVSASLDHDVRLGTIRYRLHNGYAPQAGNTSGGYYSSVVTDAPVVLTGESEKKLPISFIVNGNSADESQIWSGLQSAGAAAVVLEGDLTDEFGASTIPVDINDGSLTAKIRVTELVNTDGSIGFHPDVKIAKGSNDAAIKAAAAVFGKPSAKTDGPQNSTNFRDAKENAYEEMKYPSEEYRLLALFRFWGVINYFYPNKNLITDTWKTVLERNIGKFEKAKDAYEYQAAVRELSTELHDSHGFVGNTPAFDEKMGIYVPPVNVRFAEGKAVVIRVLDEKVPLKIGDVIETVDGKTEKEIRDRIARYFALSTPQALTWSASTAFMQGPKDTVAHLTVRTGNEPVRNVDVTRSFSRIQPAFYAGYRRTTPIVEVLPSGFGYVDLARLQAGDVDKMFDTIMKTKGVIFDMRGYPNGTAWEIAPRLTDKKRVPAALFSRPIVSGRDLIDPELSGTTEFSFRQPLPEREGEVYKGKIVMLIDETAISQAEHTCLFFEAAADVTFIGTPTNGANGDVTNVVLPGGIQMNFSGQTVRHIDGRQLQRVGILPTIKAAPTVAGLASGRDEILEAGVKFLQTAVK